MPRAGLHAGLAAAVFLVFVVASAPASLLARLAPAAVQLNGVQGTLWAGEASSVRAGTVSLGRTSWQLAPWQLLLGRLAGDLETTLPGGFARGEFAIGLGGTLRLNDFSATSPVASIVAATGMGLPVSDGQVVVELTALAISDGWPERAIGEIRVGDVPLVFRNGQPVQDQLASFELRFDADEVPDTGPLEGTLTDRGGPLEVTGLLQLTPPTNYELTGRAKARAGAPPEMQQALVLLGPESPDGGRDFSFAGSL
ncbi:MAG: type II secretion system protein N [Chromatiales bacterium]|nr:MAG: type II secretion system protein N [Chromatiales bacterium]